MSPPLGFPKHRRVVDRVALVRFRRRHPWCLLVGCGQRAEVSHIRSRQAGGDDVAANLVPLCRAHHMAWHQLGRQTWTEFYAVRLPPRWWTRIARVYPTLAAAHTCRLGRRFARVAAGDGKEVRPVAKKKSKRKTKRMRI